MLYVTGNIYACCRKLHETTLNFILACALVPALSDMFVYQEKQMMVYVERRVADDASLSKDEAFGSIRNQLCTFREGESPVSHMLHSNDTNMTWQIFNV